MTTKQFRIILSIYIFCSFFGALFDSIFTTALPESLSQLQSTLDAEMTGLHLVITLLIGLVVGVIGIASFIGLFMFKSWAPRLALITTVLALCAWPLLGVNLVSGWSAALTEFSNILWGGILVMVYFTPLKEMYSVKC